MKYSLVVRGAVRIAVVSSLLVTLTPLLSQAQLPDKCELDVAAARQALRRSRPPKSTRSRRNSDCSRKSSGSSVRASCISKPRSKSPRTRVLGRKPVEEAGSGIVIEVDSRLYILTNRHVIDESQLQDIAINLSDRRVLHPTTVWSDRETDVAVMAIDATRSRIRRVWETANRSRSATLSSRWAARSD